MTTKKKRHIKDNGLDDTFVLGLVGLMFKSNFGFPSKDLDNSKNDK